MAKEEKYYQLIFIHKDMDVTCEGSLGQKFFEFSLARKEALFQMKLHTEVALVIIYSNTGNVISFTRKWIGK